MLRQWQIRAFSHQSVSAPEEALAGKRAWHNQSGKRRHYTQPLGLRPRHDHNPQRPPRQENGATTSIYAPLGIAAESDFHLDPHTIFQDRTPLHRHLLNSEFLSAVSRRPLIINAARGPVADTQALKTALSRNLISGVAVDCWENEPDIDLELLSEAFVATPHIAAIPQGKIESHPHGARCPSSHLQDHFGLDITPRPISAGLPAIGPIPETITEQQLGYDHHADHIAFNLPSPDAAVSRYFESCATTTVSGRNLFTSETLRAPHVLSRPLFGPDHAQNTV